MTTIPISEQSVAPRFFGWRVVWAAFVLAIFGWGAGFYGPPVYLHAVIERTHWSLAFVSAAVTLHFLIGAVVVANLPALHRRFGVPSVTAAGAVALAFGVLGWALAREPWQLILATLASGAGWVAMGAAAVNAIVAPWFVAKRPAALAMAYNGASIGGVVFSPLWVLLIAELGFATASAVVAIVMVAVVGVLARRVFAETPERLGQRPDGVAGSIVPRIALANARPLPGRALWRSPRFLTLAAGMALGLFAQIGLIAHLFSLLVPALGEQGAGLAMGGATAAAIGGRSLVARLMPAGADRRLVACASYLVQVGGSLLLILAAGADVPLLLLGVACFGLGIGNATSLPPLIAQVEFVREDVQRAIALIVAIAQASYAFAPAAFGAIRALSPAETSYVPLLFTAAAGLQLLAIGCFLAGRRR
ncbi:MAG TPA: MFS transporter [Stellaceae bacterium]|nr:MFS transporter [Stellaceae bacterium]